MLTEVATASSQIVGINFLRFTNKTTTNWSHLAWTNDSINRNVSSSDHRQVGNLVLQPFYSTCISLSYHNINLLLRRFIFSWSSSTFPSVFTPSICPMMPFVISILPINFKNIFNNTALHLLLKILIED